MLQLRFPYMNEAGEVDAGGAGGVEGEAPVEGEQLDTAAEPWLRDLSEDDAYNTLQSAKQFPDHMRGLESRLFGRMGPLQEKLNSLEKSLGTRSNFNTDRIKAALDKYDDTGTLSEVLVPALAEAFTTQPLDENALRPFLEPVQNSIQQQMGEQLVLSHYSPEQIAEMIPETQDGVFKATTQKQKDFVNWYSQQSYDIQQSLNAFGPNYVHTLRRFEQWERDKLKERQKTTGAQSSRLAGGQQPTSQGRRAKTAGPQTAEEAFLAGYNSVD